MNEVIIEMYQNGKLIGTRTEIIEDYQPTESELLQAQIDALLILLAQEAT